MFKVVIYNTYTGSLGALSGLLDFGHRALRPCDPANDAKDSEEFIKDSPRNPKTLTIKFKKKLLNFFSPENLVQNFSDFFPAVL